MSSAPSDAHALFAFVTHCTADLLTKVVAEATPHTDHLRAVMHYATASGGKRFRPALACAAALTVDESTPTSTHADALERAWQQIAPAAIAVELVHTYSLIHDDLPCMDDATERRGRPAVHVQFDEARALLAGDALLTLAFAVAAGEHVPYASAIAPQTRLRVVAALAGAAGSDGMVGGQSMDLGFEGALSTELDLERLHRGKTGALFAFASGSGGLLAGGDDAAVRALAAFGSDLGLVFQIADDLLDANSTTDRNREEPSFVAALGVDGAQRALTQTTEACVARLAPFGERAALLAELARKAATRAF